MDIMLTTKLLTIEELHVFTLYSALILSLSPLFIGLNWPRRAPGHTAQLTPETAHQPLD